jgi:hypothetical protein
MTIASQQSTIIFEDACVKEVLVRTANYVHATGIQLLLIYARFQASAAVLMGPSLFWDVTQRRVAGIY